MMASYLFFSYNYGNLLLNISDFCFDKRDIEYAKPYV